MSVSKKPYLSNGLVAMRKFLTRLQKTMEEKSNENSLKDTMMSDATRLLANQNDKPKSDRLNYNKIVEIINEDFRINLNYSIVRRYVKQVHISCGRLKRGPHGTVVDDFT